MRYDYSENMFVQESVRNCLLPMLMSGEIAMKKN